MKLIVLGCDGAAGMWQYAFSQTGMEGRLTGSRDMQEEAKHEELLRMLREGWDLCLLYGSHSDSVTEKLIGRLPGGAASHTCGLRGGSPGSAAQGE